MIRKGTHIERLTKRVGQVAATGKVIEVIDEDTLEIEWDDGHNSIISKSGVMPLTDANRPSKT